MSRTGPRTIDAALEAISRGILRVDGEGRIWRTLQRPPWSERRAEACSKAGYSIVHFWLDGRQYLVSAHRLAWTVLRGPIPAGLVVNHIDGNKRRNTPSNLELCTQSENLQRRAMPRSVAEILRPRVLQMRRRGMSMQAIAEELRVSVGTVHRSVHLGGCSQPPSESCGGAK